VGSVRVGKVDLKEVEGKHSELQPKQTVYFDPSKSVSQGLKDRTLVVIIPVQHNTIDH